MFEVQIDLSLMSLKLIELKQMNTCHDSWSRYHRGRLMCTSAFPFKLIFHVETGAYVSMHTFRFYV